MGKVKSALDVLVVSDIHRELLPVNPAKTIERIVSESDADFFVNLGDNSGDYALEVKRIAEENEFPHVSVLGNHDARDLKLKSFKFSRDKIFKDFFHQMPIEEKTLIKKSGYGAFKVDRFFAPMFEFQAYFIKIESETGPIGMLFRHFPYYFERDPIEKEVSELVCNNRLSALYIVSGHWHRENLCIEGKQKELRVGSKEVPIFAVVLPPFTKGCEEIEAKKKVDYYAGLYNISMLENGALQLKEVYFQKSSVRSRDFNTPWQVSNYKLEIAKGDLLGYA